MSTLTDLSEARQRTLDALGISEPPSAVDRDAYREFSNRLVRTQLVLAREQGPGYIEVYLGGEKRHAADTTTPGHSGFLHPRARCQASTPRSYAGAHADYRGVTCQRCLASLDARPPRTTEEVAR